MAGAAVQFLERPEISAASMYSCYDDRNSILCRGRGMTSRFVAEYVKVIHPICDTCVHRSKIDLGLCLAFPSGIPTKIFTGEWGHSKPVEGDHGIQYKQKS